MQDARQDTVLEQFHPIIARWFRDRFGAPTEPQTRGWPSIAAGRDTLIAAPTGSGKTLAAFLACLDRLLRQALSGGLPETTSILYVSPLKALGNDVHRNLEQPLAEIEAVAASMGVALPSIRAAVRTGDTPAAERAKMARTPPHILVTTPESLFILLTSKSGRQALSGVRTVIVDEIHAMARDKRGAHLCLSLERLDRLVASASGGGERPVRVGLSATQRPIELIARMLGGARRELPHIIDAGHTRALDVAIEMIDDELGAVASHEQMGRVFDRIAELAAEHRTTLVFVNTRRLVERVAHALEQRMGEEHVVAHHGSMSRRLRFAAEQKLKHGLVRCAVATASLELGIDVGTVDLVVQIGSPRSIATLLQRVGRSGHSLGKTPKGRLFAMTRDQLVECAALVRALRARNLDAVEPCRAPLDILAQQLVATAACEDELREDDAFELVRRAFHYADLARADFDDVVHMLGEGVSDRRGRMGAHLYRDRVRGVIKGRRGARLAAITSGGAIPDNANYQVVLYPDETRIGDLDEDFAIESTAGDIVLLGNHSWRIRRIEAGRVLVEDAHGLPPTLPFWLGEAPARTRELSDEVSSLRAEVEARLVEGRSHAEIAMWLAEDAAMPRRLAEQAVAYLAAGRLALGAMPTRTTLVAERFFDEGGGMQLVIHAPLGGRINRAWGLALRKRFCRSFNFELQAAATDDGIVISLGQPHSFALETVFQFLSSESVEDILVQALLDSPMFEIRWRWNATRSLVVLRSRGGKKVPAQLLRMRANDLASVVFPQQQACLETIVGDREVPDHPLVKQTVGDCLTEAMDIDGLRRLIADIESGAVTVLGRDTVEPSPLGHELLGANPYAFLDDAPLEERRTRAVKLRRGLEGVEPALRLFDPAAVAQAEDEARPTARDADELHDALLGYHVLPEAMVAGLAGPGLNTWRGLFDELLAQGRATRMYHGAPDADPGADGDMAGERVAWVAAERVPLARVLFPEARFSPELAPLAFALEVPEAEVLDVRVLNAHLDCAGPRTGYALARDLGLPAERVLAALLALEADGAVLRGRFTAMPADERDELALEWCNRRILARIHRLTLAHLRAQIEPVSAAALMRFLFRWQRLMPGTQVAGAEGLAFIVEQLQGFESAAGAWEREILPARMRGYDPAWLDSLCLSGQVAWCRLSPRRSRDSEPAAGDGSGAEAQPRDARDRYTPTRAAPLALMLRQDLAWLRAPGALAGEKSRGGDTEAVDPAAATSPEARAIHRHLADRGACFLAEIASATGLAPAEVEDGLWELTAAGLASADGFASLRLLIDRRTGAHRSRTAAAGRWSLLGQPDAEALSPDAHARLLLARYGVVFRDLLARETNLPPWRDIARALRRMEARGEIRGGRFVAGFVGEQFALPEAVEGLRAMRKTPALPEIVRVAATDPLNLVGVTSAGPKVAAVVGNAVLYRDGVPLASLEAGEVVLRAPLEAGERVDHELVYHPPTPPAGRGQVHGQARFVEPAAPLRGQEIGY